MRAAIEAQGEATYVSAIDAFCDASGCLTRTTNDPASLPTWDYGHLTTAGAHLLAERIMASGGFAAAPPPRAAR